MNIKKIRKNIDKALIKQREISQTTEMFNEKQMVKRQLRLIKICWKLDKLYVKHSKAFAWENYQKSLEEHNKVFRKDKLWAKRK